MPKKAGVESHKRRGLDEKLIENLVELQKVHTNLAEKFDSLSKQISSLLALFESTAKSFATNPANQMSDKDREFLEKVDKLLEQNKTIAKGLTMMEERIRERAVTKPENMEEVAHPTPTSFPVNTRPLPKF